MVKRVYNQIKTVDKRINITVVTSETQIPAIKNQLGDKVSISIEPCRRDIFPAIVVAPYVEDSYYESVRN